MDKENEMKPAWPIVVLLWLARVAALIQIPFVAIGVLRFGTNVDFLGALYLMSLLIGLMTPARWYSERGSRSVVGIGLLLGLASPISLFSKGWTSMVTLAVPIVQCLTIGLFLGVLVIVNVIRIIRDRATPAQTQ